MSLPWAIFHSPQLPAFNQLPQIEELGLQLINQRKLPRVCCSPISGVTRLPGVRAWVFLHKQGAGYKFGGVATYRRCTNIPREEMRCQGALEIERGGVTYCHRDS